MAAISYTRCARPHLTARRISTYTILGFLGYALANVVGSVLASAWDLTLGERLIALFAPGVAFIVVVTIASAIAGMERIVFYQCTLAALGSVLVLGLITGARVERLLDIVTIGIGVFLVFGRLGCFSVGCCHGTLGRGITYGPAHVAIGFWPRWQGRPLWPVQAIEAAASAALVVLALLWSDTPGTAALVYLDGYALVRFTLELARGDSMRPYVRGLSEAQWLAVGCAVVCAAWRPNPVTLAVAALLVAATAVLVVRRRARELLSPPHLRDLDRALLAATDGDKHVTTLGISVSRHILPDGRTDWILSGTHPTWSTAVARQLAHAMWRDPWELVEGRTPGIVHVLTPP